MAIITGLKGGTTNITVSYGGKTATFSNFTVKKKTVTFTAPTLKSVEPYTRSPQTLVNAGSCTTGGTMYYYVSISSSTPTFSASSWTTTVPSKKDAGTYYLWYYVYVSDTDTYTGTGINTVTKVGTGSVTIPQQTPVLSTSPTKRGNWTYNGTEYELASGGAMKHSSTDDTPVSGTFTYAKAKDAGTYTASWSFTPTYKTNYTSVSGNVGTVIVSQATGTVTHTLTDRSLYCTSTAKAMTSTDAQKSTEAVLTSTSTNTGQTISRSMTVKKGSVSVSNWTLNSNGTVTIPSGQASGTYIVTIAVSVPNSTNYTSASSTKSATVTINSVSLSSITMTLKSSTIAYNETKNLATSSNASTEVVDKVTALYTNGISKEVRVDATYSGDSTYVTIIN